MTVDDDEYLAGERYWIDSGELTDLEAALYQSSQKDDDHITPIQQSILEQLRASGGSADIDDLIKGYYGSTLTEFDRRHAHIRQALVRLAWLDRYGLRGQAMISVELPVDRVCGAVRLLEKHG